MEKIGLYTIIFIVLFLIVIAAFRIAITNDKLTCSDEELTFAEKEAQIWKDRALKNVEILHAYCDELTTQYKYVVFNMSDCSIYQVQGEDYQQVICDTEKPLFAQTN